MVFRPRYGTSLYGCKSKSWYLSQAMVIAIWSSASCWSQVVYASPTNAAATPSKPMSGGRNEGPLPREFKKGERSPNTTTSKSSPISLIANLDSNQVQIVTQSAEPKYTVHRLESPPRVVIDIEAEKLVSAGSIKGSSLKFVSGVRVGSHANKTRVVVDLKESKDVLHTAKLEQGRIVLTLSMQGSADVLRKNEAPPVSAGIQPAIPPKSIQIADFSQSKAKNSQSQKRGALRLDEDVVASGSSDLSEKIARVDPKLPEERSENTGARIANVALERVGRSSESLVVGVKGIPRFSMTRTAPSEYVLTLRNAKADEDVKKQTLFTARDSSGIRSVRTIEQGSDTLIRIFTQPSSYLIARKAGDRLLVEETQDLTRVARDIRAQLAPAAAKEEAAGTKDQVVVAANKDAKKEEAPKESVLKGDGKRDDAVKSDAAKNEAAKKDDSNKDAAKKDAPKMESPKSESPKSNPPKNDVAKGDSSKNEPVQADKNTSVAKKPDVKGDSPKDGGVKEDAIKEEEEQKGAVKKGKAPDSTSVAKKLEDNKGEPAAAAPEQKRSDPKDEKESENPQRSVNPNEFAALNGSADTYTGRLISLDLQDADIDSALRIIAEVSNLNIVASDGVTGKVTLKLVDVPWDQALDVILKSNGLDKVVDGNVMRVAPFERIRLEREALKQNLIIQEELEPLSVKYLRVSYAKAAEIKALVETVLTERGSVAFDERSNQLIVKDTRKGLENVVELIRKVDLRTPQILLETQIVEASRNLRRELGSELGVQYIQSPATGNGTGLNFPSAVSIGGSAAGGTLPGAVSAFPIADPVNSAVTMLFDSADGTKNLSLRLSQLEQEGVVKVISRPAVATTNNKPAEIKSVTKVRIKLPNGGLSIATGSGAQSSGAGDVATQTLEAGIILNVTPQASPDYFILLDIKAKSSNFEEEKTEGIPNETERSASSSVLVSSGQTFALGGIYKITERSGVSGVPFFKDIPIIGTFFRSSVSSNNDEELLFFITPRIVEGSFEDASMKVNS